jgi:hypothetical protein
LIAGSSRQQVCGVGRKGLNVAEVERFGAGHLAGGP